MDRDGRAGIDWGVYGVPETFIVKGDGAIAFKLVGPIGPDTLESVVKPEILKAMN
jgi:cytochrome c biogenesis protein CcmG/thiol:disulfide interchange protein DsbE